MVARYVLGAILKSYTGVILICTWSRIWKQLNVNCGAIYVNGDYDGGCEYTCVEELTWQGSRTCAEFMVTMLMAIYFNGDYEGGC